MHFVEAKRILSSKNGINIYRGCTHGCIYCDSRSNCYQMQHDFEDIEVKKNAVELLEYALLHKRKKCIIRTGAMCDPYMHCEEKLQMTRKCLEIIAKYGYGLSIQTKSDRILRDMDLLKEIHQKSKCIVEITMTTYKEELCKIIEPKVCTTKRRYEILKIMNKQQIPTIVWFSPFLPFLNDTKENIKGLLDYCIDAKVKGIICFGIGMTMRGGNREYFYQELNKSFPQMSKRYQKKYGYAYECVSDNNIKLMNFFHEECEKHGIMHDIEKIFTYIETFPESQYEQLNLFP
ncbi:MAG: radical SAM protein [Lachnospiraceae bacterium]|nr:radical SAM protein [Lachnospiraceae bacterium]